MNKDDLRNIGAVAVAADILAVAIYWAARPALYSRLQDKTLANGLLVLCAYLAFCLCVYLIRKLQPSPSVAGYRGALAMSGVFFGLLATFMAFDSAGIFEDPDLLDFNPDSLAVSLGLLAGVLAYVGLVLLYPLILRADIRPATGKAANSAAVEFFSMAGVNLMIALTAVHWEIYFADTQPYGAIPLGWKLLIFVLALAFFLLFYAPPRLLFLIRSRTPLAGASFLAQCGIYVYWTLWDRAW